MGWELADNQSDPDAERWNGYSFWYAEEVDFSRLGYHDAACPLRDDRNTSTDYREVECHEPVCDELHVRWLRAAKQTLIQIAESEMLTTRDLLKMAMTVESIRSELLNRDRWALSHCTAPQVVDPWSFSPRTVKCRRRREIFDVSRALEHCRHDLGALFDMLSTAAVVFGGMASAKGRKLLPVL